MNKSINIRNFIIVGLIAALATIIYFYQKQIDKSNELESLNIALNSEVEFKTNELNQQSARIRSIETARVKDFLTIKSLDSSIIKLQNEVKLNKKSLQKFGGTLSYIENQTKINTNLKTDVTIDTITNTPVYNFKIDNMGKWVTGYGVSKIDSTFLDLKIENEYSVKFDFERKNLFSKKIPFADVKNFNPYTETKNIRTYNVKIPKPSRWGVSAFLGPGLSETLVPRLFVGVGLTYDIIQF